MTTEDTRRRVGRRGGVLLILALLDIGIGFSFIDPTYEQRVAQSAMWREEIVPGGWPWGALWLAVAVVCLCAAFSSHGVAQNRPGMPRDTFGFMTAVALKLLWATLELTGWIAGEIDQGYRPSLIWLGYALLIIWIAGLQEPRRRLRVPDGRRHS